ncbi:MAG: DUF2232 domain-containing protein [Deltaproteobacteria bacterium]|nr:DUF2232 domain-containing protein [Deltaproteobacteria bacterium]
MGRKVVKIDFSFLFAIFILSVVPLGPHFWFFIPVAVSLVSQSPWKSLRFLPLISFIGGIIFIHKGKIAVTSLDLLAYILFFLLGLVLVQIRARKISFISTIVWPLLAATFLSLLLFFTEHLISKSLTFSQWVNAQVKSEIFPYFFQPEAWSEHSLGFYDSLLAPILRISLPAWFGCMIGLAFFLNGTMETIFKGFTLKEIRHRLNLWTEFNAWKSPDWVLVGLVVGMGLVAYEQLFMFGKEPWIRGLGWNLTVLSLFPIFIQGISLTSFLIPRASFFFLIVIFILLVWVNPIPVLVLAGLSDLWFDFRSRIRNTDLD